MVRTSVFSRVRGYLERTRAGGWLPAHRSVHEAVRQFSANVLQLTRLDELSQQLTATLQASLPVAGVALYVGTPEAPLLKLASARGCIDAPPFVNGSALTPSPGDGSAGPLAPVRPSGEVRATTSDGDTHRVRWEACVPVQANGAALALIALAPKHSRTAIDEAEMTLLSMVAAQVGMALRNARHLHEIECQKATIAELQKRLDAERIAVHPEVCPAGQFTDIIGSSIALQRVLVLVEKVAPTDTSILITGETGTGKELIARAVHALSPRRAGPLVSVNCPAIPASLAESELFGHERGAFTDAVETRPGKFELADGGTIFLDEIADLPPELQVKLLRVLQERESQRVGGRKVHKLDLRVIAATNRDLKADMQAGRFREDLYYRLAAVVVDVPPLRARSDDIPMLATFFLQRAATASYKSISGFTTEAVARLRRYDWPGNVRELQHVVERAVLLCTGNVIKPEHLLELGAGAGPATPRQSLGLTMRAEKLRRVQQALEQTGGNQAAAARLLGISPSNLKRLLRTLRAQGAL